MPHKKSRRKRDERRKGRRFRPPRFDSPSFSDSETYVPLSIRRQRLHQTSVDPTTKRLKSTPGWLKGAAVMGTLLSLAALGVGSYAMIQSMEEIDRNVEKVRDRLDEKQAQLDGLALNLTKNFNDVNFPEHVIEQPTMTEGFHERINNGNVTWKEHSNKQKKMNKESEVFHGHDIQDKKTNHHIHTEAQERMATSQSLQEMANNVNLVNTELDDKQKQINVLSQKNDQLKNNLTFVNQDLDDEVDYRDDLAKENTALKRNVSKLFDADVEHRDKQDQIVQENRNLKENITKLLKRIEDTQHYHKETTNVIKGNLSDLFGAIWQNKDKTDTNDERISQFLIKNNCGELLDVVGHQDGVYEIRIGRHLVKVFCDMNTEGGGWTIIQRRMNGIVDFFQDFSRYEMGFGDPKAEYWLGLRNINVMTRARNYEMRIDLEDWDRNNTFAKYSSFALGDVTSNYRISVDGYSGYAGDALSYHNGRGFSAKDRDNDASLGSNCAMDYHGAWWYGICHASNLNGEYLRGGIIREGGVNWWHWKKNWYSMKRAEMKIRPT